MEKKDSPKRLITLWTVRGTKCVVQNEKAENIFKQFIIEKNKISYFFK